MGSTSDHQEDKFDLLEGIELSEDHFGIWINLAFSCMFVTYSTSTLFREKKDAFFRRGNSFRIDLKSSNLLINPIERWRND